MLGDHYKGEKVVIRLESLPRKVKGLLLNWGSQGSIDQCWNVFDLKNLVVSKGIIMINSQLFYLLLVARQIQFIG